MRIKGNSRRRDSGDATGLASFSPPRFRFTEEFKTTLIDRNKIAFKADGQATVLGLFVYAVQIVALIIALTCLLFGGVFAARSGGSSSGADRRAEFRALSAVDQGTELRALWVLRNTLVSRGEIDRMLHQAREAGFNILFVQVRGRGDAFYKSSIEPRAELLTNEGFDPLAYLISQAHGSGLEVHLWLNTFLVWSAPWKPANSGHVMISHPDWVAMRADKKSLSELSREEIESLGIEGVFLAPGNPEVREYLRSIVRELVQNYDADGIHLDYIRYPDMTVGYDDATRTEFMRRYGVDPEQIEGDRGVAALLGEKGRRDLGILWEKWRVSSVDALVDSVHGDLKALKPRVKLSAAVIADSRSAIGKHAQDWPAWIKRGAIDFAVPMCYSASTRFVVNQVGGIKSLVGEDKFYPGIAIYNQSPGRVAEKVRVLRNMGIKGFSMFCYDPERPRSTVFRELSRTVFMTPSRPWMDDDQPRGNDAPRGQHGRADN